jgi:hypothetical protein
LVASFRARLRGFGLGSEFALALGDDGECAYPAGREDDVRR